jgi:hypothetical protein
MSYHHHFDRLGNPVYPKPSWKHRVIRWTWCIAGMVFLAILTWGRP